MQSIKDGMKNSADKVKQGFESIGSEITNGAEDTTAFIKAIENAKIEGSTEAPVGSSKPEASTGNNLRNC